MLRGLDPLLTPDLLHALRSMGHGDDLVLADSNFPAADLARRLVRLDGVDGPRALRAILAVMPLDDFAEVPGARMEVVGEPDAEPEICRIYQTLLDEAEGGRMRLARLDRFAFYERARSAFVVVQTGELRLYGNVLLTMGVIRPA